MKKKTLLILFLFLSSGYHLKTNYYLYWLRLNIWKKTDMVLVIFLLSLDFAFSFKQHHLGAYTKAYLLGLESFSDSVSWQCNNKLRGHFFIVKVFGLTCDYKMFLL